MDRLWHSGRVLVLWLGVIVSVSACAAAGGQHGAAMRIERPPVEGGDIEAGRQLLMDYGCGACHAIPGIPAARAHVGPPLTDWSQRHYIAGSLPNTLDNLTAWIMDPPAFEPDTAMPSLGVSEEEARHMSAYLYTLGR